MRWFVAALAVAGSLLGAAPALAVTIEWSRDVTAAGAPSLWARVEPTESVGTLEVFRCPTGGVCEDHPLAAPRSPLDLSAVVAGDVFEARYSVGGTVVTSSRSPAWLGAPALVRPPSFTGELTVGASVGVVSAEWSGGWAPPWVFARYSTLFACANADGTDCFDVVSSFGAEKLEAKFAGWYVFASTWYWTPQANTIYDFVRGLPSASIGEPSADHAVSGLLGQIIDPNSPVAPAALPQSAPRAPTASVRARALRRDRRLSVARVTCPTRCTVTLTVAKRGAKTTRRTVIVTGTQALTIAPRHGKLKVRVVVDGHTLAAGTSRAG